MGNSVSIDLVLKKENEEENFVLQSADTSNFASICKKISLKIEQDLPPGYTFTLKYKKKASDRTYKLCDDEDVKRILSEPSSFEILVFPSPPENISIDPGSATLANFVCKSNIF
ncbi:hypothetical protein HK096_003357, partial [Nowakowskiella sp. JEL0078]